MPHKPPSGWQSICADYRWGLTIMIFREMLLFSGLSATADGPIPALGYEMVPAPTRSWCPTPHMNLFKGRNETTLAQVRGDVYLLFLSFSFTNCDLLLPTFCPVLAHFWLQDCSTYSFLTFGSFWFFAGGGSSFLFAVGVFAGICFRLFLLK